MGWVGSFYDGMTPAAFWTLDAAIGFGGAMLVAAARADAQARIWSRRRTRMTEELER